MTDTFAAFFEQSAYDGRVPALRGYAGVAFRNLGLALGAVAGVGLAAVGTTVAAGWMAHTALSTNSRLATPDPAGPRAIALSGAAALPAGPAAPAGLMLRERFGRARVLAQELSALQPNRPGQQRTIAAAPLPMARPHLAEARPAVPPVVPPRIASAAEIETKPVPNVPLPLRRPAREIARAAPPIAPPRIAALPPPVVEKRAAPAPAERPAPLAPAAGARTAVYDIAAHTVYLPDGRRLEAHSGIGERMDDPRAVQVKMRGPTPPNVYQLTMREQLFHGVRAIRLNPVDENRMFGRDGMLAHTYMLGPSGQSNGCVSFKNYDVFLRAFLDGEIDRMVVVKRLADAPSLAASLRRARESRYALND